MQWLSCILRMNIARLLTIVVLFISPWVHASPPMRTFTFVYILTGPATELDPKTQQEAFAGHFSNMTRMAEEGDLLVAGPYGPMKSDPNLRGLWIFTTDSTDRALELASTDPPGKLGIFVFEAVQLVTDDQLLELPRLEKEDEERRLADPDIPDEWVGRGYMLAWAPADMTSEPDRVEGVLMIATLLSEKGTRIKQDHRLVLLDATEPNQANAILEQAGCDPAKWTLDGWYSSSTHTKLPSLRDE